MVELNCITTKTVYNENEISEIEWSAPVELPSADGVAKQPGLAGPVAGIINNSLLVAGGANFPDGMPWEGARKIYQDEIYFFEKENGHISNASVSKQRLPHPIAYCATVTTPQGLVFIGGENENGISDKVILGKNNEIANELVFSNMPPLPLPLTNLAAAYHNHIIYVAGGNSKNGNSDKFFSLDISNPASGWQVLPDIPVKISFAVMAVQSNGDNDCVYLIGGRRKNSNGISDIFNTIYQFDIKNSRWQQKQSLPYGVSAATGIANNDNHILLFGGDKGETFSKEEKLNVAIRDEEYEAKSKQLVKEQIALLQSHPGFTNEVLLYNTVSDTWKKINPIPFDSPVTTTAINWDNDIIIPCGEIKAGIRTPGILKGKVR